MLRTTIERSAAVGCHQWQQKEKQQHTSLSEVAEKSCWGVGGLGLKNGS